MEDVFGQALLSYWLGDHRTLYNVRRDDGFIKSGSLKKYFRKYPQFSNIEKRVLKFVQGKVLDVGCGAGRHILYLQKRGFDVLGIDESPLAIKVCRERGCKNVKTIDIFKAKFQSNIFDTIVLFGNNLGMGGTLSRTKKLLKVLRTLVKQDGLLLLNSIDAKATKDVRQISYGKINLKKGRYIGVFRIRIEYKKLIGKWFEWTSIEPKVLGHLASASGWEIEKIYKGQQGNYSAVLRATRAI